MKKSISLGCTLTGVAAGFCLFLAGPLYAQEAVDGPGTGGASTGTAAMAGGGTSTGRSSSDVNYELRLRELEDRMNELKEDIFRSKSRLFLLRETILRNEVGGSRAVIRHVNELSSTYTMLTISYSLDGEPVLFLNDDGNTDMSATQMIYDGALLPGPHNLAVSYEVQGNGRGVFEYMEGYRIPVLSSYQFDVEEGQTMELDVVIVEAGGVNRPLEERPDVRYEVRTAASTMDGMESDN
jgi:hypothetical protein